MCKERTCNVLKIIGLTGASGSGKGYVSAIFSKYAITSIDTDKVVHALYKKDDECKKELRETFGEGIFNPYGSVCRTRLRKIVFSDAEKLKTLNSVVHKHVIRKCEEKIAQARKKGKAAIVIDAPLLYEAGMDKICDFVIAVVADIDIRRERISARDNISESDIEKRMQNQKDDSFFTEKADYTLINNGETDVTSQIENILASEGLL